MQQQQIFKLPTMPFHRDISNGCPVGSSIRLTGKPYEDANKFIHFRLITRNNDTSIHIGLELGSTSKIKIDSTISGRTSSSIECLAVIEYQKQFELLLKVNQFSFEILLNNSKISDFVHRVDPTLINKISIEGPLICEQVIIDPTATLPSYEQATSPPTNLLANMTIDNPKKQPISTVNDLPPPPARVLPSQSTQGVPSSSSGFFYSGGSQGFSNHPYPLPGLIDQSTHASQPLPANPLPQPIASAPSAPPVSSIPSAPPISTNQVPPVVTSPPYPTSGIPQLPIPRQPYNVTFPPSEPVTPATNMVQPVPATYANQAAMAIAPPPPMNSPYMPPVMQPMMPPMVQPMMQPIVQNPYIYPQYYYSPEVYYEYPHHHHHHRHHHHHHCD